jgi:UDP-3-O-[3-hydroxymyristoyl] N-acetylglucosamine deacetylase
VRQQRTIQREIECSGIGLHSGERVRMTLRPASVDTGVVFMRNTDHGVVPVRAYGEKVVGTQLCTSIGDNGTSVKTVEHLMSALAGLQVDNITVELDSPELPILDGSAEPFVSLLLEAGIIDQDRAQPVIRIVRPLEVRDGDKYIRVSPPGDGHRFDHEMSIHCTIRFNRPIDIHQTRVYSASPSAYVKEIACARTFGFLEEVEALRGMGLAKGGSLDNAVVISSEGVVNEGGLRWEDEFIRHKILDMIGDLSLLGRPLSARIEAFCPGHQLNTQLVSAILGSPDSWVLDKPQESRPAARPLPLSTPASVSV